jgi:hypothetical protein
MTDHSLMARDDDVRSILGEPMTTASLLQLARQNVAQALALIESGEVAELLHAYRGMHVEQHRIITELRAALAGHHQASDQAQLTGRTTAEEWGRICDKPACRALLEQTNEGGHG